MRLTKQQLRKIIIKETKTLLEAGPALDGMSSGVSSEELKSAINAVISGLQDFEIGSVADDGNKFLIICNGRGRSPSEVVSDLQSSGDYLVNFDRNPVIEYYYKVTSSDTVEVTFATYD